MSLFVPADPENAEISEQNAVTVSGKHTIQLGSFSKQQPLKIIGSRDGHICVDLGEDTPTHLFIKTVTDHLVENYTKACPTIINGTQIMVDISQSSVNLVDLSTSSITPAERAPEVGDEIVCGIEAAIVETRGEEFDHWLHVVAKELILAKPKPMQVQAIQGRRLAAAWRSRPSDVDMESVMLSGQKQQSAVHAPTQETVQEGEGEGEDKAQA